MPLAIYSSDFGTMDQVDVVKTDEESDIGANYVWSYKPNPAVLAEDGWRSELACAVGTHVEFIMKDISIARRHPERLWDWVRIAMEVSEEPLK